MTRQSPPFESEIERPPVDGGLPSLSDLFDSDWVWQRYVDKFGEPEETPGHLRISQFDYHPQARAVVSYVAERAWDDFVIEEPFAIRIKPGAAPRVFRYPADPYLPGLAPASTGPEAHALIARHVGMRPIRVQVETVRYRSARRGVLRHRVYDGRGNEATLFARVMQPARLPAFMATGVAAARSPFLTPRLVGASEDLGIVWMTAIPGETVRRAIQEFRAPPVDGLLTGLAGIWALDAPETRPLDVRAGFESGRRLFAQMLGESPASAAAGEAEARLEDFVESWLPTANAHNDFYDDQVIVTPEGEVALVDFEEIGPGDPMMDVANLSAHLSWISRFGDNRATAAYRREVREAALRRFRWDPHELTVREAYCIYRLSTNAVRHLRPGWKEETEKGLRLALAVAAEAS
ncbi:MAG: phosphotransferase [Dehalococcoidia bacterium]|nr:phosphotransferase [Dehalococcoidia bacterium]